MLRGLTSIIWYKITKLNEKYICTHDSAYAKSYSPKCHAQRVSSNISNSQGLLWYEEGSRFKRVSGAKVTEMAQWSVWPLLGGKGNVEVKELRKNWRKLLLEKLWWSRQLLNLKTNRKIISLATESTCDIQMINLGSECKDMKKNYNLWSWLPDFHNLFEEFKSNLLWNCRI